MVRSQSVRRIITMKTIDLVYFNAGGGHRSAALALDAVIRELALPWAVRLVNLFEVLDPRDVFGKTTGMKPEQYYNARLARGWTLGLAQELKVLAGAHSAESQIPDRPVAASLAQDPARHGGIAGAEFQSRHVSGADRGPAAMRPT